MKTVRDEYKDFQDQKKIEDLLTVKFDVEAFNEEMLSKPSVNLEVLEQHKSELEEKVMKFSENLNLVLCNEKTLTYKV